MPCTWWQNVYVQLHFLVRVSTHSQVQLKKKGRTELHIDSKNKTKGANITDTEMIYIAYRPSKA